MVPYRPSYVAMRIIAQNLAVLATAQLAAGQSQLALDSLRVNFRIAAGVEDDGSLVGYMISSAINGLTIGVIAHGLRDRRWDVQQLGELDRLLAPIDMPAKFPHVMRSERALANQHFAEWVAAMNYGPAPTGMFSKWEERLQRYRPEGWLLSAQSVVNEIFQEDFIPLYDVENRLVRRSASDRIIERTERLAASRHPRGRLAASAFPSVSRAIEVVVKHQTWIHQGRLAVALERFRWRQNRLPDTLVELVPEFMDELPRDLVGGRPLQYRRLTDDHYLLWAAGWNEVDEGGIVGDGRVEGDWVWFGF